MKRMFLIGILALSLLAVACEQQVVCNKPYIRFANTCCLDTNNDSICDSDKQISVTQEQPSRIFGACTLSSGIACIDNKVETTGVVLLLQNSLGYPIRIESISFANNAACIATPETLLNNGDMATFMIFCETGSVDEQFSSDIRILVKRSETGSQDVLNGKLVSKIQPSQLTSPTKLKPSMCTLPVGVACIDHIVETTGITLILQNTMGYAARIDSISFTDKPSCTISPRTTMNNGDQATFSVRCLTGSVGDDFSSDLKIGITRTDTNLKTSWDGNLVSTVQ